MVDAKAWGAVITGSMPVMTLFGSSVRDGCVVLCVQGGADPWSAADALVGLLGLDEADCITDEGGPPHKR